MRNENPTQDTTRLQPDGRLSITPCDGGDLQPQHMTQRRRRVLERTWTQLIGIGCAGEYVCPSELVEACAQTPSIPDMVRLNRVARRWLLEVNRALLAASEPTPAPANSAR
ncbi:MAG: hypothetical protein JO352_18300 [Chloroflexi bacterium]|nr:hypothetical protein [Chloroflexota bacterium]MBV9599811.1 hypothetical protein [Chloroflexota bacterium]